ncbi:hypothetical protein ABK040_008632 [Willaertia magna]
MNPLKNYILQGKFNIDLDEVDAVMESEVKTINSKVNKQTSELERTQKRTASQQLLFNDGLNTPRFEEPEEDKVYRKKPQKSTPQQSKNIDISDEEKYLSGVTSLEDIFRSPRVNAGRKTTSSPNINDFQSSPISSTTNEKIRSLPWLKTLISTLYEYANGLFEKKKDDILKENYTVALIVYTIMQTRFGLKSVTDMNWYDMIKATKTYCKINWEVLMFYKFLSGEYPLKSFFLYINSKSALLENGEDLDEGQWKILQELNQNESLNFSTIKNLQETRLKSQSQKEEIKDKLSNYDISTNNNKWKSKQKDGYDTPTNTRNFRDNKKDEDEDPPRIQSRYISLTDASKAFVALADLNLIKTKDFIGLYRPEEISNHYSLLENEITEFIKKRFKRFLLKETNDGLSVPLSELLGYFISVRRTTVSKILEELNNFVEGEEEYNHIVQVSPIYTKKSPQIQNINTSDTGSLILDKLNELANDDIVDFEFTEFTPSPIKTSTTLTRKVNLEKTETKLTDFGTSNNNTINNNNNISKVESIEKDINTNISTINNNKSEISQFCDLTSYDCIKIISHYKDELKRVEDKHEVIEFLDKLKEDVEKIITSFSGKSSSEATIVFLLLEDLLEEVIDSLKKLFKNNEYSQQVLGWMDKLHNFTKEPSTPTISPNNMSEGHKLEEYVKNNDNETVDKEISEEETEKIESDNTSQSQLLDVRVPESVVSENLDTENKPLVSVETTKEEIQITVDDFSANISVNSAEPMSLNTSLDLIANSSFEDITGLQEYSPNTQRRMLENKEVQTDKNTVFPLPIITKSPTSIEKSTSPISELEANVSNETDYIEIEVSDDEVDNTFITDIECNWDEVFKDERAKFELLQMVEQAREEQEFKWKLLRKL